MEEKQKLINEIEQIESEINELSSEIIKYENMTAIVEGDIAMARSKWKDSGFSYSRVWMSEQFIELKQYKNSARHCQYTLGCLGRDIKRAKIKLANIKKLEAVEKKEKKKKLQPSIDRSFINHLAVLLAEEFGVEKQKELFSKAGEIVN